MKFKFVATTRDIVIFAIFAIFLLYVVALGVLNIPQLASQGTFYGLNPLEAFSPTYIYYTLIFYLIALGGLIMSVNSYFFEFEDGVGVNIGEKTSGGYSRWAKAKEIKTDKDVERVEAAALKSDFAGVPLISNGHELWVDNGEFHTLVIGATGSGKTQDTILPSIKILAKKGESVVVTDPKGEIYEKAGGLLKKNGYNIILLNFRNPQNGNTWNPLELPYRLYKNGNQDKAIELLDDLALNILYDETNANSDPFWEKTAADYFSGIALAMFEDTTEDKININSINMTATVGEDKFGGSTYIKEYFNLKDPSSAAYVNASGTIMAPSETKGGIISVFKQKVKLFASRENLSEMLSYSDFPLDSIGKQPTAVFVIIQDEKKTYHSLATILIKQIYETLIDVAQENGGKLPVRTNFLLDEFANMPPLKDITTMITAARSRQIRFTMIIQNFAQLNKVYGKDEAETIKGNCGNIIYLITKELAALEEISKLCGEKKSKKDDKTASTPLVSVSDLQRMKQFDHILLRMRKNPFKTSFVPDFKTDWGPCTSPKVEYPVREKKPVAIFDIREFVKEQKNKKISEMMASLNEEEKDSPRRPSPFERRDMDFPFASSSSSYNRNKPDLSVNDIVKKIDEKLAEIEREEQEAKKKKEQEKNKISEAKIESTKDREISEKRDFDEMIPVRPKTAPGYGRTGRVETLDDDDDDFEDEDFLISNDELEKKINEKLSSMAIEEEKLKKDIKEDVKEDIKKEIKEDIKEDIEEDISNKIKEEVEDKVTEKVKEESKDNYEPYNSTKEDEELLKKIESDIQRYQNEQNKNVQNNNVQNNINSFKPTSTIKLDDIEDEDKFFDDFFDD